MKKITIIFFLLLNTQLFAQKDTIIVDQIIARVGDEIILQSKLEGAFFQWTSSGNSASSNAKCRVFEDLLVQSLLINQSKVDSVFVTPEEIDMQVNARMDMFIKQAGGETELENYLNKSIFDIKSDLKRSLKDQLLAEKEREFILKDINITPSEVADYFNTIPPDSLPLVDITYEIRQIVFKPKLSKQQQQITIDKITEIRKKIANGERKFASMARMYSQDEVSAKKGGELGFMSRADLDPDFAAAAFSLQKNEISEIVKTQFGYHIIKVIERRGQRINLKHILIRPIIPPIALQKTIKIADSVKKMIILDSLTFKEAADRFSEDENTKNNGGLLYNPQTQSAKFKTTELKANIRYEIKNLNQKQISEPISTTNDAGNPVVKIYKIEKKTPQHVANLKNDYKLIQDITLNNKKNKIFSDWIKKQQKHTYISIHKNYKNCDYVNKGWTNK